MYKIYSGNYHKIHINIILYIQKKKKFDKLTNFEFTHKT